MPAWTYHFEKATSLLSRQPAEVPMGGFPLLVGMDGRYDGTFRRYPGHLRFPDSTLALGSDFEGDDFDIDYSRYFEVQKQAGSTDRIRGFFVGGGENQALEIWYRFNTDDDGVIRKQELEDTPVAVGYVGEINSDGKPVTTAGGVSSNVATGSSFIAGRALVSYTFPDVGEVLVAGGFFTTAGGQQVNGIARLVNGSWEPVGNGFNNEVLTLAVWEGRLLAGGAFTKSGTQIVNYLSQFETATSTWVPFANGTNGVIRAIEPVPGEERFWVGGDFTHVNGSATESNYIAEHDGTDWAAHGTELDGIVRAIAAQSATDCYIGGDFENIETGPTQVNFIARITGGTGSRTFAAIPDAGENGLNAAVHTLIAQSDGSGAIAGGEFTDNFNQDADEFPSHTCSVLPASLGVFPTATGTWDVSVIRDIYQDGGDDLYYAGDFSIFRSKNAGGLASHNLSGGTVYTGYEFPSSSLKSLYAVTTFGGTLYWAGRNTVDNTPEAAGADVWDISTRGRYIYLVRSNGNNQTLSWDTDEEKFTTTTFGIEAATLHSPTVAADGVTSGHLVLGNYEAAYRFFDNTRLRWTGLSDRSLDVKLAADEDSYRATTPAGFSTAPSSYSETEFYSTISGGDTTIAAGGSLYRAVRGSISEDTRRSGATIGHATDTDNGIGSITSSVSDVGLPTRPRYDFDRESPGIIGRGYAIEHFQGITFVLEEADAYLQLRWSPPSRVEPENFPPLNFFPTKIRAKDGATCRLIGAGDFLLLLGGNYIYRIQRTGGSVGIIELAQGHHINHRDAIVRVGGTVFAATGGGVLEITVRSGVVRMMTALSKLFQDRWRGQLIGGDPNASLRAAWDARMQCVYFHHRALGETLCLWIKTGKVTLLQYNFADSLVTAPDLNDESVERAYFLSNRRWIASPNWKASSGDSQTMTGLVVWPGWDNEESGESEAQITVKYNTAIESIGGTGTYQGATITKLVFPHTTGNPFVSDDYMLEGPVDFSPMPIIALNGSGTQTIYKVVHNTEDELWVEGDHTSTLVAGDIMALSPVVSMALGSNMTTSAGATDQIQRKIVEDQRVVVGRVSSSGDSNHRQTTPVNATYGLLTYGVSRNDDVEVGEPRTSDTAVPITPHSTAFQDGFLGQAFDTDKPSENIGRVHADGTILFPWWLCYTSNLAFEIHRWFIKGRIEASTISGPGV